MTVTEAAPRAVAEGGWAAGGGKACHSRGDEMRPPLPQWHTSAGEVSLSKEVHLTQSFSRDGFEASA
ncbi:hypothetical protein AV530_005739 [Patagioenas fasciata monilis]|uniref:Uncharacterized protein n=1 Tax=Patagioenas fasciata monilis TaxID=372326 RepID=A0A1V4JNR5_PATFA|nr:hypothetical protein AV530_005739 [Patagioenas fasciata monilis]